MIPFFTKKARDRAPKKSDQEGAALILALFLVVLLTTVVGDIVTAVRSDVNAIILYEQRTQAQYNARAGLGLGKMLLLYDFEEDQRKNRQRDYLLDLTGQDLFSLTSIDEIWSLFEVNNAGQFEAIGMPSGFLPIEVCGGAEALCGFWIEIEDLGSKFPINRMYSAKVNEKSYEYKAFMNFLRELEIEEQAAQTIVDSVLDWIDLDSTPRSLGAESNYYEYTNSEYSARDGQLRSPSEIKVIQGVVPELWPILEPIVTVYPIGKAASTAKININTAPASVLVGLHEDLTLEDADMIVSERVNGPFRNDSDISAVFKKSMNKPKVWNEVKKGKLIGFGSDVYKVTGIGFAGGSRVQVTQVIHRKKERNILSAEVLYEKIH